MASITHTNSTIRIASVTGQSVCTINGVNPDMTPQNAIGFLEGIEELFNNDAVTGRISTISSIERQ